MGSDIILPGGCNGELRIGRVGCVNCMAERISGSIHFHAENTRPVHGDGAESGGVGFQKVVGANGD